MQYKFGRKFLKGTFYYTNVTGLSMAPFWSDTIITSCQARIEETETY